VFGGRGKLQRIASYGLIFGHFENGLGGRTPVITTSGLYLERFDAI
jgi:hypothetical protein